MWLKFDIFFHLPKYNFMQKICRKQETIKQMYKKKRTAYPGVKKQQKAPKL